jgi:hypothetical protein
MRATIESMRRGPMAIAAVAVLVWSSAASLGPAQIILAPNQSTNLSYLVGVNGLSLQVGDKLFDDFSFVYSDTTGIISNYLPSSALNVTALSNSFGFGISFTGPLAAIGDVTKDITLRFSVEVLDPNLLISDVHLSYNGAVVGAGFARVDEQILIGGFGGTIITNVSVPNPQDPVQSTVFLPEPLRKIYVEKDIMWGGGAPGSQNSAFISVINQTFSQIPEPSTLMLSGAGLVALVLLKRRK